MFTKAVIAFVPAAFAAAVPPARSPTTFIDISTLIGNDYIHPREINASGQRFYVNKATRIYCPKDSNATVFASSGSGTLSMYAAVPGGQQVYVASGGTLGYTVAYSGNVPQDSQKATFNYDPQENMNGVGTLTFDNQDLIACLTGKDREYQVHAWIPKVDGTLRTDCTSITFRTVKYTKAAAWSNA